MWMQACWGLFVAGDVWGIYNAHSKLNICWQTVMLVMAVFFIVVNVNHARGLK
jgi:hypothetical protein